MPCTEKAYERGVDFMRLGQCEAALACMQEHLLSYPADVRALHEAGRILCALERFDEAAGHLRKALHHLAESWAKGSAAVVRLTTPHGTPEPFGSDGPTGRNEILTDLGDCYAALGNEPEARACYEKARDLAPGESGPHLALGAIAMRAGDLRQAERNFLRASQVDPSCAAAYGGLAMARQEMQDYAAAFDMYLKCLELDSNNLVALLGLFQTSCQMGTFAKVIHYLEVFLEGHPDDASVLFCLATLYARDGRLQEAGRALLTVLSLQPDNVEAATLLARGSSGMVRMQLRAAATV